MKIGFLINYFYPFLGGAESNCFYLAKELVKKGHEVHIFTSDRKNNKILTKEEMVDGIHIHRSKTWFRYKYYLVFTPGLLTNVLRYDLDVLHLHSFGFLYHDFVALVKKIKHKTKLVNTPHGPFMALKEYSPIERILKTLVSRFEKISNRFYDAVIEVNPTQKSWLTKYGIKKNKIFFVPNGISEESFKKSNPNLIKKYNLKNKFILTYIGRVQKYKGLDQVLRILPYFNNIVFVIIGENADDKERLVSLIQKLKIKEKVIFTGRISENTKSSLLDASKVFILPSEWEAFGITILEAMARGNTIISTTTEGGKFLVGKENGFLYEFGDTGELRLILEKIIRNPKILETIGENNEKKSLNFKWSKIVNLLEDVYAKIS
ncbi:MAG: glycosyltransferase family 4 protein [Candidatus Woesearchaeota archaeon]